MDECRTFLGRRFDVDDHAERLVLDVDELSGINRMRARVGDHDRDAVALVVDLGDGERKVLGALHLLRHRPGARHRCLPVVAQVDPREHCDDALGCRRGGRVDRHDRGVRVRATDDDHHDGSGKIDVVDVRPAATQKGIVLLALQRGADETCLGGAHDALPAAAKTASTMLW